MYVLVSYRRNFLNLIWPYAVGEDGQSAYNSIVGAANYLNRFFTLGYMLSLARAG